MWAANTNYSIKFFLFSLKISILLWIYSGGGMNVGINVSAAQIQYNDIEPHVVDLLKYVKSTPTNVLLSEIDGLISSFGLSKTNADGFAELRDYYNQENNSSIGFYTLLCYAFNYQIRLN